MTRHKRLPRNDEGFGLVLVMGLSVVLLGLVGLIVSVSINSIRSAKNHQDFQNALAVAETGVDQTLATMVTNKNYNPCGCAVPAASLPFTTEAGERTWAKSTFATLLGNGSLTTQTTAEGEYAVMRPSNKQTVYSLGWVPNRANAKKTRLIKSDYLFAPFKPGNALTTQGDLTFSGSVTVQAAGSNPTAFPAPVHTNSAVSSSASSITVQGDVTSTGNYGLASGANVGTGSGGSKPQEAVPTVDPLTVYRDVSSDLYASQWFDLCPTGQVRAKVVTSPSTPTPVPCTGTLIADAALTTGGLTQYGWSFSLVSGVPTWRMGTPNSNYTGTYYVYQGDAEIDGGTNGQNTPWNATVLVEAGGTGCARVGGNLSTRLTDISSFLPGFVLVAGADLTFRTNLTSGDGVFSAADQVYMQTSSASLTGFVVASDACPDTSNPSSIQGVTINFDNTLEVPLASAVRTTQWLEYVG